MKINFRDTGHKEFYLSMQEKCREWDIYHKVLFYTLGICPDCRDHIEDLFCFDCSSDEYGIKHETAFMHGWHTSGSMTCVRMAFNLFNGYQDDETDPSNLFAGEYAIYFVEALKIRYPDTFSAERYCVKDKSGRILNESISSHIIAESYAKVYEKQYGCECIVDDQKEIIMEI